jgi:hypothetical protein
MKKVFASFIGILLVANLLANDPYMVSSFAASSIKAIEASTSGGNLTLSGEATSEAVVEMYVSYNGRRDDEKIEQLLDENYTIDIRVENDTLRVEAKPKKTINWNLHGLNISFKIIVPHQTDGTLRTSGGNISINNLSGSQTFKTSGGSLSVENVSGNISGRTSGGNITVRDSKDRIELRTSGGSITASDCSGTIELKTSGGSIRMSNLVGNIDAATSGGNISARGIRGTITTATSGGSVNLK